MVKVVSTRPLPSGNSYGRQIKCRLDSPHYSVFKLGSPVSLALNRVFLRVGQVFPSGIRHGSRPIRSSSPVVNKVLQCSAPGFTNPAAFSK